MINALESIENEVTKGLEVFKDSLSTGMEGAEALAVLTRGVATESITNIGRELGVTEATMSEIAAAVEDEIERHSYAHLSVETPGKEAFELINSLANSIKTEIAEKTGGVHVVTEVFIKDLLCIVTQVVATGLELKDRHATELSTLLNLTLDAADIIEDAGEIDDEQRNEAEEKVLSALLDGIQELTAGNVDIASDKIITVIEELEEELDF